MTIYVSELPKKCEDCVFSETGFVWDSEVRFCKLKPKCMNWIALYDDKRDDCPLQSLSDYTKQVRKEVCEEIAQKMANKLVRMQPDGEFGTRLAIDWYDVNKVLDQIQGVEDGRNIKTD